MLTKQEIILGKGTRVESSRVREPRRTALPQWLTVLGFTVMGTAQYLSVKNKGLIRDGYDADLVLFDFDELRETATYSNSNSLTEGIDYVFVNGQIVYQGKQFTGRYPGRMLRHNA